VQLTLQAEGPGRGTGAVASRGSAAELFLAEGLSQKTSWWTLVPAKPSRTVPNRLADYAGP